MAQQATPMSGVRKAAIALMALGEEGSTALLRHMQDHEIEKVAREIAALGAVTPETGEQVLMELSASAGLTPSPIGGVEQVRRLLVKGLGADEASRILERIVTSLNTSAGFAALERANPEQLSKFIVGEHPQTTAVILAHLDARAAAHLLEQLPEEMRAEVLLRMASLDDVAPEVLARVSAVIEQQVRGLGASTRAQRGGVRAVAELFNNLNRSISRPTLERLESVAPDTATAIRNLMFVFDDLLTVEEAGIREIVNRADKKALTVALKGAADPIRQRFFANMSKRAADLLKEEIEVLGAVRLRDVEKAQQDVVAIARKLEEEGLITTGAGAGEAYVT